MRCKAAVGRTARERRGKAIVPKDRRLRGEAIGPFHTRRAGAFCWRPCDTCVASPHPTGAEGGCKCAARGAIYSDSGALSTSTLAATLLANAPRAAHSPAHPSTSGYANTCGRPLYDSALRESTSLCTTAPLAAIETPIDRLPRNRPQPIFQRPSLPRAPAPSAVGLPKLADMPAALVATDMFMPLVNKMPFQRVGLSTRAPPRRPRRSRSGRRILCRIGNRRLSRAKAGWSLHERRDVAIHRTDQTGKRVRNIDPLSQLARPSAIRQLSGRMSRFTIRDEEGDLLESRLEIATRTFHVAHAFKRANERTERLAARGAPRPEKRPLGRGPPPFVGSLGGPGDAVVGRRGGAGLYKSLLDE